MQMYSNLKSTGKFGTTLFSNAQLYRPKIC